MLLFQLQAKSAQGEASADRFRTVGARLIGKEGDVLGKLAFGKMVSSPGIFSSFDSIGGYCARIPLVQRNYDMLVHAIAMNLALPETEGGFGWKKVGTSEKERLAFLGDVCSLIWSNFAFLPHVPTLYSSFPLLPGQLPGFFPVLDAYGSACLVADVCSRFGFTPEIVHKNPYAAVSVDKKIADSKGFLDTAIKVRTSDKGEILVVVAAGEDASGAKGGKKAPKPLTALGKFIAGQFPSGEKFLDSMASHSMRIAYALFRNCAAQDALEALGASGKGSEFLAHSDPLAELLKGEIKRTRQQILLAEGGFSSLVAEDDGTENDMEEIVSSCRQLVSSCTRVGEHAKALTAIDKTLRLEEVKRSGVPLVKSQERKAELFIMKARVLILSGKIEEGIGACEPATKLADKSEYYELLGDAYVFLGNMRADEANLVSKASRRDDLRIEALYHYTSAGQSYLEATNQAIRLLPESVLSDSTAQETGMIEPGKIPPSLRFVFARLTLKRNVLSANESYLISSEAKEK